MILLNVESHIQYSAVRSQQDLFNEKVAASEDFNPMTLCVHIPLSIFIVSTYQSTCCFIIMLFKFTYLSLTPSFEKVMLSWKISQYKCM